MDSADAFARAHAALRADPSVQFDFQRPDPPPQTPAWLKNFFDWLEAALKPVGRFFNWLASFLPDAPYARILLWIVLALLAAALLWLIVQRIRTGEWRFRRRLAAPDTGDKDEWTDWAPEAAPARSWLDEAEALAQQGRFAEAVHHLLVRSVEDIARRRPQLVRPSLTSRELAVAPALPGSARSLFARIARLVERSWFGGSPVSQAEWETARNDYSEFALAKAWQA